MGRLIDWALMGDARQELSHSTCLTPQRALFSKVPHDSHSLSPCQILLISDYFYAFLRREYYLTHGLYLTAKDGTEAMLVLK